MPLTKIDYIVVLLCSLQVFLDLSLEAIQVVHDNLTKVPTPRLLQALGNTRHSIPQARNLLAKLAPLEAVTCGPILRRSRKMMVFGRHVVNPSTTDGVTLDGRLTREIIQIGDV